MHCSIGVRVETSHIYMSLTLATLKDLCSSLKCARSAIESPFQYFLVLGSLHKRFFNMIDVHEPVGSHDHEFASQSAKSSVVVSKQEIMQSGLEERHELARLLRGQQLRIPDLHRIFQGWPEAINVDIAALRIDVDQTLERYQPSVTLARSQ